jgi:hypothetical protein
MKTSFKTNKLEINVSWRFRIKLCYETFQNRTTQARTEKMRNRKRRNKVVAPHDGKRKLLHALKFPMECPSFLLAEVTWS